MVDRSKAAHKGWATRRSSVKAPLDKRSKTVNKEDPAKKEEADFEASLIRDERVRLLSQENLNLKRRLAKAQAKTDIIIQSVEDLMVNKNIIVDIPHAPKKDKRPDKRTEIPVFCLGDWHFGYYHPHGAYAYDVGIAKKRVHTAVDKFISTANDRRTSARIEELRLYLIGDMVEGEAMRPGHGHEIEGPVIQQAIHWAPECLSSVIVRLMGEFRKIKVIAVPGNHGRNGPPRGDAHPATNWDRVCYQTTRLMVNNAIIQRASKRINDIIWDLPSDRAEQTDGDDWFSIDYVFDWCNCLLHGEDIKGKGWGGIPFYGVEKMIKRYADIVADPIDFMYMGHIHVDANIPSNFREVFVNGAVESSTGYARKQLIAATPPSQSAVFYTADNGPISRHTFHLDERVPQGVRTMRALKNRERLGSRLKS